MASAHYKRAPSPKQVNALYSTKRHSSVSRQMVGRNQSVNDNMSDMQRNASMVTSIWNWRMHKLHDRIRNVHANSFSMDMKDHTKLN